MSVAIPSEMVYTPMMINDVFTTMKNKALDMTSKALLKTSTKLISIARDELCQSANDLELSLDLLTIEDIKEINPTAGFKQLDDLKDKLSIIHDDLENSTATYERVLFDVVDETLDHITKLINMFMYLNSKLTRHNFKVA